MMTTSERIDTVLDRFDFQRVRATMVAMKWEWNLTPDGAEAVKSHFAVPSIDHMRKAARQKLEYVMAKYSTGYISSGGFTARHENNCLTLAFEVEHAASYGDPDQ